MSNNERRTGYYRARSAFNRPVVRKPRSHRFVRRRPCYRIKPKNLKASVVPVGLNPPYSPDLNPAEYASDIPAFPFQCLGRPFAPTNQCYEYDDGFDDID